MKKYALDYTIAALCMCLVLCMNYLGDICITDWVGSTLHDLGFILSLATFILSLIFGYVIFKKVTDFF